jgi:hypothetical protein
MEINQTKSVDVRSQTIQELFDKMWTGLKSQGFKQSLRESDEHGSTDCALRGDNGRKCAVGHVIPDELMNPCMEAQSAVNALVRNMWLEGTEEQINFMALMQNIHDESRTPILMETSIREFAARKGCKIPGEE